MDVSRNKQCVSHIVLDVKIVLLITHLLPMCWCALFINYVCQGKVEHTENSVSVEVLGTQETSWKVLSEDNTLWGWRRTLLFTPGDRRGFLYNLRMGSSHKSESQARWNYASPNQRRGRTKDPFPMMFTSGWRAAGSRDMLRLPETEAQCKPCSDLYISHDSGCPSNRDKNKR